MKNKPPNIEVTFTEIEIVVPPEGDPLHQYRKELIEEGRTWQMRWGPQNRRERSANLVTKESIKKYLTEKEWAKFGNGQRTFIREITREMAHERMVKSNKGQK